MKFSAILVGSRERMTVTALCLVWVALIPGLARGAIVQDQEPKKIMIEGTTMGPLKYHVVVAKPPLNLNSEKLQTAVDARLDRINRLMSTYLTDSDVTKFNRLHSTEWFGVDAMTAKVVSRAIELSVLSEGAFDITVAPAVDRWRFGPTSPEEEFKIPTTQELASLKSVVGFQSIEVRNDPPSLKKSKLGVSIDLSAIAPGYAVDVLGETLNEMGCLDYMIEVSGETLVKGERAGGGKWRIGIQKPDELSLEQAQEVLELTDCAIATSGDYRNYRAINGKRYSHTIDPRTCAPVVNRVASVSVISEDCMTADGVATAIMVLGPEQGLILCEKLGVEALIKVRDEEFGDNFAEFKTSDFPIPVNEVAPSDIQRSSIWPVFLGAIIVFSLAVLAMASGAIFGNKPIKGSCGGIANAGQGDSVCGVCSKPVDQCPDLNAEPTEEKVGS